MVWRTVEENYKSLCALVLASPCKWGKNSEGKDWECKLAFWRAVKPQGCVGAFTGTAGRQECPWWGEVGGWGWHHRSAIKQWGRRGLRRIIFSQVVTWLKCVGGFEESYFCSESGSFLLLQHLREAVWCRRWPLPGVAPNILQSEQMCWGGKK